MQWIDCVLSNKSDLYTRRPDLHCTGPGCIGAVRRVSDTAGCARIQYLASDLYLHSETSPAPAGDTGYDCFSLAEVALLFWSWQVRVR